MKYALDTNIFIDAFRTEDAQVALFAFLERALPFTYLSAVVMQELAAGARTAETFRELQRGVFEPFRLRRRVFAPTPASFVDSGRAIASLARTEGWQRMTARAPVLNDALLAVSCRDYGITLITMDKDFARIAPFVRGLRYVESWPSS